jgi:hypothetical protein
MRFTDILLEYDRGQTVNNYGDKVVATALKDRSVINALIGRFPNGAIKAGAETPEGRGLILDYVMGVIEQSDPTKNKNYAQAITRLYTMGDTMLEDIESTLSQYLVKFDKLKNKKKIPAPHNDFMRYKSLDEFMSVVEQLPDPDSDVEKQKIGAVELPPHDSWRYVYGKLDEQGRITSDVLVIQPLNKFAGYWWAKEYPKKGVTNRWCTAWEGDNSRFDYYAKQGPLYIIIPANRTEENEKYQFHFETKQFMDFQDHQIGDEGMDKLAKRFPALQQIFKRQAIQFNLLGLMSDDYKAAVRSHSRDAAPALAALITEYQDRIANFGFSSLGDYGITLPEGAQQELNGPLNEYLAQARDALVAKNGFWSKVISKLGSERNEDALEVFLNTDPELKKIAESSAAGHMLAEMARDPAISRKIDASHLQDLIMRDPIFRFIMRQVPKLYKEFLTGLDAQQVNEHIVKVPGGYELKSKHGNKNLGKYPTKAGAEKRERQVQYFKHLGENGDLGDDDGVADGGFFVVIASEDDGAFVGMVTKDGGRWRESAVAGDAPGNWGGNYMSYLTPDDVMQHIRNDYRRSQVKGPFYAEDQAMEYAQRHFGLGDDSDYFDDEDDLEEGRVKDFAIQKGERDEMNPQQFRAGYGKSQSDWDADNKGMFTSKIAAKKKPSAAKKSPRALDYCPTCNRADNRCVCETVTETNKTGFQVVCDGRQKHVFSDPKRAVANAKSMFKHEKEYTHIGVVDLSTGKEVWSWNKQQVDEVSNEKLAQYKKAASAQASAADKAGDYEKGNKRFRGIVKATLKQGENDAKKHKEQGVAEDDWHSDEVGDSWHGGGNEPKDAWHSADGGTGGAAMPAGASIEELMGEQTTKPLIRKSFNETYELIDINGRVLKSGLSKADAMTAIAEHKIKPGIKESKKSLNAKKDMSKLLAISEAIRKTR